MDSTQSPDSPDSNSPPICPPDLIARFWTRVDVRGPDECWPWLGSLNTARRGIFHVNRKQRQAHRFAYELTFGVVPIGSAVTMLCEMPTCVNPAHMTVRSNLMRFFEKVVKTEGCWLWSSAKTGTGYGNFWRDTSYVPAHCFAYEALVGPVPAGQELHHRCENKGCVNPDHLQAVTRREHRRLGTNAFAVAVRRPTCPRGHLYEENLRRHTDGSRRCRICERETARQYYRNKERVLASLAPRERSALIEEDKVPLICSRGHVCDRNHIYVAPNGSQYCGYCRDKHNRNRRSHEEATQ